MQCISTFFLAMVYFLWYIIIAQKYFALEMQFSENIFFPLQTYTKKKSLIKMFVVEISCLSHDTLYANDPYFHNGQIWI